MKYRDCNDGEWFWLAKDESSFGKTFDAAKAELVYDLENAISEIEEAITKIQDWKEGTPLQVKLSLF
jgi:hypothetical protein